ncbi:MAG TPA: NAD-dependent epimerase/dehydratase family protein [Acidimicrobiales bacterium]|nr:NAD-dependent epimerase/dehydratase family protein [Acidimicrobiales bacterium]
MRALVTGGAGFIGSNLTNALLAAGHSVCVLDDLSTGYADNVPAEADLIVGDVADESAVARAVAGADVVFHHAAHRAVLRSVEYPLETDRANTHGTLTVLKASLDAGVQRVVYASSSSVYGGAKERPTPESSPVHPRSPYAVTKLAGELYCTVFAELYGLSTVSLRYFNVFGPRQRPDSAYAAVIPLFIDALTTGGSPTVHGDGGQSRAFAYVDDVVAVNMSAAIAPAEYCRGDVYNIGGLREVTLLEMLDILGGILGVEPRPVHVDPRPGDIRHSSADTSAARARLGYEPKVSLEEGLARTVAFFAGHPSASASSAQDEADGVTVGGG